MKRIINFFKIRILQFYIIKAYIKIFALVSLVFLTFFIVADLLDISKSLVTQKVQTTHIISYYLHIMPFYFFKHIIPLAGLVAVFISFGLLMKNNEITAMQACGLSISYIAFPIFVFSILLSAVTVYLNTEYLPKAKTESRAIKSYKIKKKAALDNIANDLFLNLKKDYTITADTFYFIKGGYNSRMERVVITKQFNNKIIHRLDGEFSEYKKNEWILSNGKSREWDSVTQLEKNYKIFDSINLTKSFNFNETPAEIFDFHMIQIIKTEEFTLNNLKNYQKILLKNGVQTNQIEVDILQMFFIPIGNIILLIFAMPIALYASKNNIALGFGISLLIAFGFWVCSYIFIALGRQGIIEPIYAVNIANVVFLCAAIFVNKYLKNKMT